MCDFYEMLPFYSPPVIYQLPRCSLTTSENDFHHSNTKVVKSNVKMKSNSFSSSRDSEWLTLEVCREFMRETCPREALTCRYAHPPKNVCCNNGRVVCCYDFIKGRCHRYQPPCKYLHPPNHLKDQLLENGKANLLMKTMHSTITPQDLHHSTSSNCNTSGSYNWAPLKVFSPRYSQSQSTESSLTNHITPVSFISPLPYFFLPTSDNQNINSPHQIPLKYHISTSTFENERNESSQIKFQQCFFNNAYGPGQFLLNTWPLCTYPTVPY